MLCPRRGVADRSGSRRQERSCSACAGRFARGLRRPDRARGSESRERFRALPRRRRAPSLGKGSGSGPSQHARCRYGWHWCLRPLAPTSWIRSGFDSGTSASTLRGRCGTRPPLSATAARRTRRHCPRGRGRQPCAVPAPSYVYRCAADRAALVVSDCRLDGSLGCADCSDALRPRGQGCEVLPTRPGLRPRHHGLILGNATLLLPLVALGVAVARALAP